MAEEIVDTEPYLLPWYSRVFEYLKNRNKIGPAKIELPDCDFFIVGAGRTIRVLRKSSRVNNDEQMKDNFTTTLARQSNSSTNNCRCSFRRSLNLTNKERFVATEINRIKTNLNENIDNNIDDSIIITNQPKFENDVSIVKRNSNDLANKNKIIKDLEKYIDVLLEEVLNDTVKFMNDADTTLKRSRTILKSSNDEKCKINESIDSTKSPLDISFAFPADDLKIEEEQLSNQQKPEVDEEEGYVNKAFDGTTSDPDCLNFDLSKPINNHQVNIDCVDSGINSVETVELQLETELTLEQSLMKIIDATFGHETSRNWNDLVVDDTICNKDEPLNDSIKQQTNNLNNNKIIEHDLNEIISNNNTNDSLDLILDDTNIDNKFKNSRLKLNDDLKLTTANKTDTHKKTNPVVVLCEKFTSKLSTGCGSRDSKIIDKSIKNSKIKNEPVEMRDYRASWKGFESPPPKIEKPINDSIVYRKNIKPIIVFIHGFGSSADVFELQIEYFTQLGYCCIAPDMLGHGMSSSPNKSHEYHFDKLLNDLELVLQHYAFSHGQKCILIAHNYGCSFATAIACKYENFIHQLVLISGGGPTILTPPSKEGPGHCCMRATLSPLLMCGLRRDILYSPRGRQHPYCGNETQDQWPSHMPFILDGMIWPDGDYVYHRRISTPTLLIYGLRDNLVSLVQECQMERTMMKAFLEVLPNAGHMPMTECPEMCNHMINCFIDLWNKNKK